MNHHLVVTQDFGQYKKGQKIEAADEVAMILASPQHTHVVKIAAPQASDLTESTSFTITAPAAKPALL